MSAYVIEFEVEGDDFLAAGEASNSVKEALKKLGIASGICRRAAIIMYEAEMNMVIHAQGGKLKASIDEQKIEIIADDEGPGIPDLGLAMKEGWSTAPHHIREMGFGAGMGLPNIRRNADTLDIDTAPGEGTKLVAVIRLDEPPK